MHYITIPLNALMGFCYGILDNYILAILAFTLLTKIILLPLSLWLQRNGIKMVELMPEINRLKIRYFGDKDTIAEETQKLYKRMNYHPFASTIPMIIQLVLLMGVIEAVKSLLGSDTQNSLLLIPAQTGGVTLLMPLAAGVAALMLTLAQNKIGPLQREQEKAEKISTGAISVGISLFLGAFVSLGTGVYWIASNLFSILNQLLCNAIIPPAKYIDYAVLEESRKELGTMSSLGSKVSKDDKKREKADYKRFFSVANKHLVFYSEKSGFYKYFKNTIEYLLEHSNVVIHYVTNDPQDQIFKIAETQPRIRPYYIGPKKIITLFMKMDADIVVMTTPDLENYFLKRSYVRKDIEYVYTFHGMTSTNMVVRKGAYDHFDTIFCVGQHQIDELRETEQMYHLPEKTLVPVGYGMLDDLLDSYEKMQQQESEQLQVMIAPSWQEGNLLDVCIEPILKDLMERNCNVILRPHPEYIKRFYAKAERLKKVCSQYDAKHLELQLDFSSNETIYTSSILITDWSGIANEFAYTTKRPVLFIDTPAKVLNEDYVKYHNQPTDITLRNQLGRSISPENIEKFGEVFDDLVQNRDSYQKTIEELMEHYVFNIGASGEAGARYLLDRLMARNKKHAE